MKRTGMCNRPDSDICSTADVALRVACETTTDVCLPVEQAWRKYTSLGRVRIDCFIMGVCAMYVSMCKQAGVWGSGGMLPQVKWML